MELWDLDELLLLELDLEDLDDEDLLDDDDLDDGGDLDEDLGDAGDLEIEQWENGSTASSVFTPSATASASHKWNSRGVLKHDASPLQASSQLSAQCSTQYILKRVGSGSCNINTQLR